ncbi:MAG TPA: hypothetical protein DEA08_27540, partial [Planctomycetes bacterium]|nr:hypothetical protein [Planctomycetota bacterium]
MIRARPRSLTDFEQAAFAPPHDEPPTPNRPSDPHPTGRFLREGLLSALRAPFLRSLLRVPLKKIAIWASFLGLIYFLRDFFGLIFLTFVLSYIAATIVERISPYFSSRRVPVVLVFVTLVLAIVGLGAATIPRAIGFGEAQLQKLAKIEDPKHYVEVRLAKLFDMEPPSKEPETGEDAKTGEPAKT